MIKQCTKNFAIVIALRQSNTLCKIFNGPAYHLNQAKKEEVQKFVNSLDIIVTDCDGVLWHGNEAIPGSSDTLDYFRKIGKKVFFVTNSPIETRKKLAEKAGKLGFDVKQEEVILPSYLIAHYLKCRSFCQKAYVIGSAGIGEELDAVGVQHIGIGPDMHQGVLKNIHLESNVGAVIVGSDEHFNLTKLTKAASYLNSQECLFLATNPEKRSRLGSSIIRPSSGTLIKAVEVASARKATIVGKPHAYVRKIILSYCPNPAKALMIGDSFVSDIPFGSLCGFNTLLVLSGNTSSEDLEKLKCDKKTPLPDVVLPKLGDLLPLVL